VADSSSPRHLSLVDNTSLLFSLVVSQYDSEEVLVVSDGTHSDRVLGVQQVLHLVLLGDHLAADYFICHLISAV
jgi:hypothetical protein